jgi:hypothetical protein
MGDIALPFRITALTIRIPTLTLRAAKHNIFKSEDYILRAFLQN